MKKDTALKIIFVALAAIVVLWFAKALLFPTGYGMGIYISGNMAGGYEHMQRGYVYTSGGTLALLLTTISKVLFALLVVGLVVGVILFIKNNVFTEEDKAAIKNSFAGKKAETKKLCEACGKEISADWKVCPHCGKEVSNTD